MSYILHIETSTKVCSVALSKMSGLVKLIETNDKQYTHGENLTIFIEKILSEENLNIKELCAISVSSGPGSYTGLRIGTSVAKGFCYALNIPLIEINSIRCIENIARKKHHNETIIPMIDARRMEVYYSVYNKKSIKEEIETQILTDDTFKEYEPFVVCGDGVLKIKELWSQRNIIFEECILSSAEGQVELAWEKFNKKEFADLAYFEPFYLKEFNQK